MTKNLLILIFIVSLSILSCKNRKERTTQTTNTYNNLKSTKIEITITHLLPYCKGVAPQSEEDYRVIIPEANKDFYITQTNDSSFKTEFKTNDSGKFTLSLPPGKYCIKRAYKNIDFENFLQSKKGIDNEYIEHGDRNCYYNWWKSCDGSFEISPSEVTINKVTIQLTSNCFTGDDPCKFYKGPMPP